MRKATVITHVAFEDLDSLEQPLRQAGFDISFRDAARHSLGAEDRASDLTILMGGPIGVYERSDYPFLTAEIEYVRDRIARNLPTLGICLGAQVIAAALGARVYPGHAKEIGWSALRFTEAGAQSAIAELNCAVLHWHGDTFDLPREAQLLASSTLYPHQAFSYGRALALQFHPEISAEGLERWYVGHAAELGQFRKGIVPELRAAAADHALQLSERMGRFLTRWLSEVGLVGAQNSQPAARNV